MDILAKKGEDFVTMGQGSILKTLDQVASLVYANTTISAKIIAERKAQAGAEEAAELEKEFTFMDKPHRRAPR